MDFRKLFRKALAPNVHQQEPVGDRERRLDQIVTLESVIFHSNNGLRELDRNGEKVYFAKVGSMPNRRYTYFYGDTKYRFFFYIDPSGPRHGFDIDVQYLTTERFSGPPPRIAQEDIKPIEEAIAVFFSRFAYWGPKEALRDGQKMNSIAFSWDVK